MSELEYIKQLEDRISLLEERVGWDINDKFIYNKLVDRVIDDQLKSKNISHEDIVNWIKNNGLIVLRSNIDDMKYMLHQTHSQVLYIKSFNMSKYNANTIKQLLKNDPCNFILLTNFTGDINDGLNDILSVYKEIKKFPFYVVIVNPHIGEYR